MGELIFSSFDTEIVQPPFVRTGVGFPEAGEESGGGSAAFRLGCSGGPAGGGSCGDSVVYRLGCSGGVDCSGGHGGADVTIRAGQSQEVELAVVRALRGLQEEDHVLWLERASDAHSSRHEAGGFPQ